MRRKNDHRLNHLTTQFRGKLAASIALILTLSCLLLPSSASGQTTYTWNTNGLFFDQFNGWDPFGAPGNADIAQFSLDATDTVLWNATTGNRQIGKLHVLGGNYTFNNLATNPFTLTMGIESEDTILVNGANTSLTVQGLNLMAQGRTTVTNGGTFNLEGNHAAGTQMTNDRLYVGGAGGGSLNVLNGASAIVLERAYIDGAGGASAAIMVDGPGSKLQSNLPFYVGHNNSGTNTLTISNGGLVDVDSFAFVGSGPAATGANTINVTGTNGATASTYDVELFLHVGDFGNGAINVTQGGRLIAKTTRIGRGNGANGNVTVDGNGSAWVNTGDLTVGISGTGILNIQNSGVLVSSRSTSVGLLNDSSQIGNGTVNVNNNGTWNSQATILLGMQGNGTLNIDTGGTVSSSYGVLGQQATGVGTANVGGTGSLSSFQLSEYLTVGDLGTGQLNINTSGVVTVGTTTSINANSAVTMNGGTFNFGTTDLDSYGRIGGTSGKLIGTFNFSGFNDMSSLSGYEKPSLDISGVLASNSGTLYGTGNSSMSLNNLASGEVRTLNGEWARFAGGVNFGELNNYGGTIEFEDVLLNRSEGLISGRGLFIANGGLANSGVIAMSGGFSDFQGDIENSATGTIAIGGGSVTTFYDDVMMDATNMNIDVAQNSTAVFFGSYNGGSNGLGDVHIFGDLRPGNSPASVFFGGDVLLGSNTFTEIELAGDMEGEFDKLNVAGDLDLAGLLSVSLIDNFQLRRNQTFVIADVDGSVFGQFSNFNDNDIVYTQGDIDLFVTYDDGNGNVMLYSSIPEPSSALLLMIAIGLVGMRRPTR